MKVQEEIFKGQIKNRGHYGGIVLEAESTRLPPRQFGKLEVTFNQEFEISYKDTVLFAVNYFYDNYAYHFKNSIDLKVNIILVRDMLIDTTNAIICYVTVMALSKVLDFEIKDFKIDKATGIMSMPLLPS